MRFSEIFSQAGVTPIALAGDAEVTSMVMDTRRLSAGGLFVCMPGTTTDSHSYLAPAVSAGAVAAIVYSADGFAEATRLGLAAAQLPSSKQEFADVIWRVCDAFFEHPTREMKVVGVTGTNGKTTTAWLIRDTLQALGVKAAYLGTLGFQLPGEERELANTTPFAVDLYNLLAEARDKGVEALAMEVSSHALKERRVEGVEFDVGVFTNLTQDHLDYHGSMEDYEASKRRLFLELPSQTEKHFVAALNMDDTGAASLAHDFEGKKVLYGAADCSYDLGLESVSVAVDRITGRMCAGSTEVDFEAQLGGSYNVENLLSATAALMGLGYELGYIANALSEAIPVPGRFEAVPNGAGIGILVDYAHTPDALEKLLDAVKPLTKGRVITVFGCGGDRDRTKRPKMALAASERSDVTVATSDNPRTEDAQAILDEVLTGIQAGRESIAIIDRGEAISHAVCIARPGDVVVIAGKGHENYQIIGRTKYPMDDRELARRGLEARAAAA
ncbi:MAG: UDP-N-acetylmuramoyl-L-alanyl-D-glutamate--2,6-diaminopimelate ligase [Fimbriimonas sp.]